jgi:hypothetical protein
VDYVYVLPVKLCPLTSAELVTTVLPEKVLLPVEYVQPVLTVQLLFQVDYAPHVLPAKVLFQADHVPHVLLVIIVLVVSRRYPVRPGHILMRRLRVHTPMIVRNVLSLIIVRVVRQH